MGQKEKEIKDDPKYNKKNQKVSDSRLSPNNVGSKLGDTSQDYSKNRDESNMNMSVSDEPNNFNSSSLNSSANVSQLNKTSRVQHRMSILQRNHAKIAPIFREMISMLVKESGDKVEVEEQQKGESKENLEDTKLETKVKIDMRNMLGFLNQNLYHDYLNITNIMKLKRLDFRDVYGVRCPDLLMTRENLMERVMLLITSYFCMGTELRFLKQMMVEGFEDTNDSEFWHGKALELAINFLPGDAPLVKHIVSSYQKHHSPSFEQIPEDEEVQSEVKIIRPNEGITYNKVSPCIRDIPKPSVKLAPLDLPLNCYNDVCKTFSLNFFFP